MKAFFRILCLGLAVVLAAGSLTALAVRQQILKPETYLYPLNQSGIYSNIEEILTVKATAYLGDTAKAWVTDLQTTMTPQTAVGVKIEPLVGYYLDTLIDKQTAPLVTKIASDFKIAGNLEAANEQVVAYVVGWLAGTKPDPKFFAYIPEPDKLEAVKAQGLVPFITQQVKSEAGIADLPPCSNTAQVTANLKLVLTGKVSQVTCYSPEIRTALDKAGQVLAPQLAQTQMALTLNAYLEKYQIKTIANDLFNTFLEISRYKQTLIQIRGDLALIQVQARRAFWLSLGLVAVGLILTEKKRLRTLFVTYLWVGGLMLLLGIGYTQAASRLAAKAIPDQFIRITDPAVSTELNQKLARSVETAAVLMVKEVATPVKFVGGAIALLSIIGWSITAMVSRTQEKKERERQQQPELFEAVEVEAKTRPARKTKPKKKTK